jgi:hypothetical protein
MSTSFYIGTFEFFNMVTIAKDNYMLQVQTIINQRAIDTPKKSLWQSLKFW